MPATKIATCCFCGTRAALVLRGKDRHELSCGSCGAPLHDMKQLHPQRAGKSAKKTARKSKRQRALPHESHDRWVGQKGRKKKKSLGRRFLSEVFDVIEDILD